MKKKKLNSQQTISGSVWGGVSVFSANMDPTAINTDFSHLGFWIQGRSLVRDRHQPRSSFYKHNTSSPPSSKGAKAHGEDRTGAQAPARRVRLHFSDCLLDLPYREHKKKQEKTQTNKKTTPKRSVLQHLFNQDFQTIQEIISHSTPLHNLDCDPKLFWQNPFKVLHSRKGGKPVGFMSRNCKIWAVGFLSSRFAAII